LEGWQAKPDGVVFGGEIKEHHPATSWYPSKEGNLHRKLRASLKIISNTPALQADGV